MNTFRRNAVAALAPAFNAACGTLAVTAGDPFRSPDRGRWVVAGELPAGERIATECGARRLRSRAAGDTAAAVYNLEVAGTHSYFVGRQRLWVHNGCEFPRRAPRFRQKEWIVGILDEAAESGHPPKRVVVEYIRSTLRDAGLPRKTCTELLQYLDWYAFKVLEWYR